MDVRGYAAARRGGRLRAGHRRDRRGRGDGRLSLAASRPGHGPAGTRSARRPRARLPCRDGAVRDRGADVGAAGGRRWRVHGVTSRHRCLAAGHPARARRDVAHRAGPDPGLRRGGPAAGVPVPGALPACGGRHHSRRGRAARGITPVSAVGVGQSRSRGLAIWCAAFPASISLWPDRRPKARPAPPGPGLGRAAWGRRVRCGSWSRCIHRRPGRPMHR